MPGRTLSKWLAAIVAIVTLGAGTAMADGAVLTGTVSYRERIMLPPTASVRVQLLDVSLADAPAKVLGEATAEGASPPYHYTIAYDPGDILPGHRYAVSARITDGDELLFISTTQHAVFSDGPDATDVMVERVMKQDLPDASAVGEWLAEDIAGGGVMDYAQTTLTIAADGAVHGSGGCNRFSGSATIDGSALRFSPLAATNMACTPAQMDQEQKFFAALGKVAAFRLDRTQGKLVLLDDAHDELAVLAAR